MRISRGRGWIRGGLRPAGLTLAVLVLPAAAVAGPIESPFHFDLTVTVVGDGDVRGPAPTDDSGFIDCPDFNCFASIATDATITLTATPDPGWVFAGWSGDCLGTAPCTLRMDQARSVRATFTPQSGATPQTLSISLLGPGTVTSDPAGIACPPDCSAAFPFGSRVTLSGAASPGATFNGFQGDCFGSGSCDLTMDRTRSVTAVFTGPGFRLDVTVTGSGVVVSAPDGVACPPDCDGTFGAGSTVSLTPLPAAGWAFAGWSGDCAGTGPCAVTIDRARAVGALFSQGTFPLDVAVTGPGVVTSAPAGIACPTDCTEPFAGGRMVTLTAVPAAGALFAGWEGDCAGTGTCTVTMASARAVTARFTGQTVPLSVTVSGSGTVTSTPSGIACPPTCAASFPEGTLVTLSAVPSSGWELTGWSGACAGAGTCQVRTDAARSVAAAFAPRGLTINVVVRGNGTVSSAPAGIACPAVCEASFAGGTSVILTTAAGADWTFAGWQGVCAGAGGGGCTIPPGGDAQAIAVFTTTNPNVDRTSPGSANRVDGYDLAVMLEAVSSADPRYDLNGDGATDLNDLNVVLQALGRRSP